MTAPTPILDSADARYVELAAFIAMQPGQFLDLLAERERRQEELR